jgi:hypothetical protein
MGATEQSASYFRFLTSYHEMLQFASCYDSQIPSILLMGPTRRFVAEWGMLSRMFEPRPWHKLMYRLSSKSVFPRLLLLADPFWLRKITTDPHIPAHVNTDVRMIGIRH